MRRYIWVFIVGFLVVLPSLISAEPNLAKPEPLQLTIKADKDIYGSDEPISIEIRITNIGEAYLGVGKDFSPKKKVSPDVLIPKNTYITLMVEAKGSFELGMGSIALDDETMEKVLTGKLEPLEREDFVSIPPGHFYGRKCVIDPQANVRGRITGAYYNKYPGEKAGITAWTGRLQSNIIDIKVQDK